MVTVRTAKSKGSAFEMDCAYSLKALFPEIRRPGPEGFKLQYDLECDSYVFECKRLKSLSWNEAEKYYKKLIDKTPNGKDSVLIFKSNQQPCLIMTKVYKSEDVYDFIIVKFEDYFGVPFKKHETIKTRK